MRDALFSLAFFLLLALVSAPSFAFSAEERSALQALLAKGQASAKQKRHTQALQIFEEAFDRIARLSSSPQDTPLRRELALAYARSAASQGRLLAKQKRYTPAIALFRQAVSRLSSLDSTFDSPDEKQAWLQRQAPYFFFLSRTHELLKEIPEAYQYALRCLEVVGTKADKVLQACQKQLRTLKPLLSLARVSPPVEGRTPPNDRNPLPSEGRNPPNDRTLPPSEGRNPPNDRTPPPKEREPRERRVAMQPIDGRGGTPPPPPPKTTPWQRVVGGTLLGLAIGGIAAGIVLILVAEQYKSNYNSSYGICCEAERSANWYDTGHTLQTGSWIGLGVGGGLLVLGIPFLIWDGYVSRPKPPEGKNALLLRQMPGFGDSERALLGPSTRLLGTFE